MQVIFVVSVIDDIPGCAESPAMYKEGRLLDSHVLPVLQEQWLAASDAGLQLPMPIPLYGFESIPIDASPRFERTSYYAPVYCGVVIKHSCLQMCRPAPGEGMLSRFEAIDSLRKLGWKELPEELYNQIA